MCSRKTFCFYHLLTRPFNADWPKWPGERIGLIKQIGATITSFLYIFMFLSVTISTDFRANLAISGNWVIFSHQYSFRSNPEKHTHSDILYLCYPVQHFKNIDLIWVKYCLCDFFYLSFLYQEKYVCIAFIFARYPSFYEYPWHLQLPTCHMKTFFKLSYVAFSHFNIIFWQLHLKTETKVFILNSQSLEDVKLGKLWVKTVWAL